MNSGEHFVLEVCVLDTGNSVELHIDKSLSYVATYEVDQDKSSLLDK